LPTLVLRSQTLKTVIGVYDWERVAVRTLVFDFWLEAAQRFTVNREQMEVRLRGWVAECRYQLLEALAEQLISEFACQRHRHRKTRCIGQGSARWHPHHTISSS
jgi:dihydroneopterin aldolase